MRVVKLGDICSLRNGYAFKSESFSDEGVPIIRISDIQNNLVNPQNAERIVYDTIFENFRIVKGDVLIAMSGATTGKFGVYNSDEDAFQNQRVGCFRIKDSNQICQLYLFFVLNIVKPIIERKANGGAQPNISSSSIEEIQIPLPPLEDQIRIATILSKVETLIKQRKESIDLLDDFIKSTFFKMFGDPVRNERGWEIERLDKIAKLERGRFSPRPRNDPSYFDGDYPFIQTGDISRSGNRLSKFTQTLNEKGIRVSKKFNKGTIVIAIVGATIGATAILEIDTYATDSIIGIIPKTEFVNTYFLEFTMQFWKPVLLANAPEAARPNINLEILKKVGISNPPIELQNQFAQIVEKTETLKAQYQQSLQELEGLFGSLSQKAFKGELDLSKFKIKIGEDLGMEESEILMAAEPEVEYLKSKG